MVGLMQRLKFAFTSGSQPLIWGSAFALTAAYAAYEWRSEQQKKEAATRFEASEQESWNANILAKEKAKKEAAAARKKAEEAAAVAVKQ
jgi:Flp pilus assembly protein TadB